MNTIPYVGVTGVENAQTVEAALCGLYEASPDMRARQVKVGVSLRDDNFDGRDVENIIAAAKSDPKLYTVVHYEPKEPTMLHENLLRLCEVIGSTVDGVQVECDTLPHPKVIDYVRSRSQCVGFVALRVAEADKVDCKTLVRELRALDGLVEVLSLDYTRREMIPLYQTQSLLGTLEANFPSVSIVLTGNVGPGDIPLMWSLAREHPGISLDTIAGTKMSAKRYHQTGFDPEKVRQYIRRACETL